MGVAKGTKTGLQEEDIRDGLVIKVCGTEEALRTYLLAGGRSAARVGPPTAATCTSWELLSHPTCRSPWLRKAEPKGPQRMITSGQQEYEFCQVCLQAVCPPGIPTGSASMRPWDMVFSSFLLLPLPGYP